MNEQINAINKIYSRVEKFIDMTQAQINAMSEKEWHNIQESRANAYKEYESAQNNLLAVLPHLSPSEISDSYLQSCRLLQRNLSGFMVNNFNIVYVNTMKQAIRDQHWHTAWLFLQAIADHIGEQEEQLFINCLTVPELQETALSIIGQLRLTTAIPLVKRISEEVGNDNKFFASEILRELNQNPT